MLDIINTIQSIYNMEDVCNSAIIVARVRVRSLFMGSLRSFSHHNRWQILLLRSHIVVFLPTGMQFVRVWSVFKVLACLCNLWEVCVPDVFVWLAGSYKCSSVSSFVRFCVQWEHSVFSWEPGLSVAYLLDGQAVFAESVSGFPQFWVGHGGQVFCSLSVSLYLCLPVPTQYTYCPLTFKTAVKPLTCAMEASRRMGFNTGIRLYCVRDILKVCKGTWLPQKDRGATCKSYSDSEYKQYLVSP